MAQKVITTVELTDDIDGSKGDRTIRFSIDGSDYEIDLSKKNATAFEKALKPYLDAARPVTARRPRRAASGGRRRSGRSGRQDLTEVRVWAKEHGYEVNDRGRIPNAVIEAYESR